MYTLLFFGGGGGGSGGSSPRLHTCTLNMTECPLVSKGDNGYSFDFVHTFNSLNSLQC